MEGGEIGRTGRLSWSHSDGVATVGAAFAPLGGDVERWTSLPHLGALHADATDVRERLRGWLRREALVKLGLATLDDAPPQLPPGYAVVEWHDADLALAKRRRGAR